MDLYSMLSDDERAAMDAAWEEAKRKARRAAKKARKQTAVEKADPNHVHGTVPADKKLVTPAEFASIVRGMQRQQK